MEAEACSADIFLGEGFTAFDVLLGVHGEGKVEPTRRVSRVGRSMLSAEGSGSSRTLAVLLDSELSTLTSSDTIPFVNLNGPDRGTSVVLARFRGLRSAWRGRVSRVS